MKKRVLTTFEYDLLQKLLLLEQDKLLGVLEKYLIGVYSDERVINGDDNFLYAIGDIPILLVAHLDTVHRFAPYEIFYDKDKNVIWSPEGLGADDRAGVFAILRILANGFRPHVLFTTDEEIGGLGAYYVTEIGLVPQVNFVIELDRQGENDSVFYWCDNEKFETYINKFGFKTDIGTFSDISVLCPECGVS